MEAGAAASQARRVIALDTHVLLWWLLEPRRLSKRAAHVIADADQLGVPAIVFWEVALLARKGKVTLGAPAAQWTADALSVPRVQPLSITAEIAVRADALAMHADLADRFIVATADTHGVPLVTRDRLIRRTGLVSTVW